MKSVAVLFILLIANCRFAFAGPGPSHGGGAVTVEDQAALRLKELQRVHEGRPIILDSKGIKHFFHVDENHNLIGLPSLDQRTPNILEQDEELRSAMQVILLGGKKRLRVADRRGNLINLYGEIRNNQAVILDPNGIEHKLVVGDAGSLLDIQRRTNTDFDKEPPNIQLEKAALIDKAKLSAIEFSPKFLANLHDSSAIHFISRAIDVYEMGKSNRGWFDSNEMKIKIQTTRIIPRIKIDVYIAGLTARKPLVFFQNRIYEDSTQLPGIYEILYVYLRASSSAYDHIYDLVYACHRTNCLKPRAK